MNLANNDNFNSLVEDIKGIYVAGYDAARQIGFQTLYSIGKRISQTDFKYGEKIVPLLAKSTGISTRNIYRAINFEKKLGNMPLEEYLLNKPSNWSVSKEYKLLDGVQVCLHEETEEKKVLVCKKCGKVI